MFQRIITKEFITKFYALKDEYVGVCIKHLFYGAQKIKCVLHPLFDGERIGLIINNEDKYIMLDELVGAAIVNDEIYLKSDVMEISIKLVGI